MEGCMADVGDSELEKRIMKMRAAVMLYGAYAEEDSFITLAGVLMKLRGTAYYMTYADPDDVVRAREQVKGFLAGFVYAMQETEKDKVVFSLLDRVCDAIRFIFDADPDIFVFQTVYDEVIAQTPKPKLRWEDTSPTFSWLLNKRLDEAQGIVEIKDGRVRWTAYVLEEKHEGIAATKEEARAAVEKLVGPQ